MGFEEIHLTGFHTRVGQGAPNGEFLGLPVGSSQPIARAVLSHGTALDDSQHRVPGRQRILQPFEDHEGHALAETSTVGGIREGPAAPRGGQATRRSEHAEPEFS